METRLKIYSVAVLGLASARFNLQMVTPESDGLGQEATLSSLDTPWSPNWYFDILVTTICFLTSGLASGLTIGLASIDKLDLELKARINPKIAPKAEKVFAVTKNHHWMLVTLLVVNAAALEVLPLYLSKVVSEFTTMIIAVLGVLIVGEIIP
jgi:metal transporter CNNM